MKKLLSLLFAIVVILPFSFMFIACDDNHEHTFSTEWSHNETYHWHESTCGHDVVSDKDFHNFQFVDEILPTADAYGYKLYRCRVCGYEQQRNYTCLVTYVNDEEVDIPSAIVERNGVLPSVNEDDIPGYVISAYYNAETGAVMTPGESVITKSMTVRVEFMDEDTSVLLDVLTRIEKLEELAHDYYANDGDDSTDDITARHQVLAYLREGKYSDSTWGTFCYTVDADFKTYVEDNQGTIDVVGLRSIDTLNDPFTSRTLDFIHACAVMNMFDSADTANSFLMYSWSAQNEQDLSGWGGDLVTLVNQVLTTSGDPAVLFNSQNGDSSFGAEDLIADIDGVNIYKIYEAMSTPSISGAIRTYYFGRNSANRITAYKTVIFSTEIQSGMTDEEMVNAIYSRLQTNIAITAYCYKTYNSMSYVSANETTFKTCIRLFVDYLTK